MSFLFSRSSILVTLPLECLSSTWATPSWAAVSWACPSPWPTPASCSSCECQNFPPWPMDCFVFCFFNHIKTFSVVLQTTCPETGRNDSAKTTTGAGTRLSNTSKMNVWNSLWSGSSGLRKMEAVSCTTLCESFLFFDQVRSQQIKMGWGKKQERLWNIN